MRVAHLCRQLYRALQDDHHLEPRYEVILYIAAVLHEIGLFISNASHHKHSLYIINNSEIFGLSRKDVRLVGLVARYHRRASPKPTHPVLRDARPREPRRRRKTGRDPPRCRRSGAVA